LSDRAGESSDGKSIRHAADVDPNFRSIKITPSISSADAKFPGSEVLAGGTPSEVYRRLTDGDPLRIADLVLSGMSTEAVLWHPIRLVRATVARAAHDSWTYRGEPALDIWLRDCFHKAVELVTVQIQSEELQGLPPEGDEVANTDFYSRMLRLEPPLVRRAILEFHALPLEVRKTFFAVFMEGQKLDSLARSQRVPQHFLEDQVGYAVQMMSTFGQSDAPCPSRPEEGDRHE
jgi:hypothetical protein